MYKRAQTRVYVRMLYLAIRQARWRTCQKFQERIQIQKFQERFMQIWDLCKTFTHKCIYACIVYVDT